MSAGATPASSKAAFEAVTVGDGAATGARHGLETSNEPWCLVRMSAAFTSTGVRVYLCATLALHNTSAAPPSAGLQNMYLRSGRLTGIDSAMSAYVNSRWRHACGLSAPCRNDRCAAI